MGIRRRDVDQHGIERQDPLFEELGHLGQEDRHVVSPPFVDRGAGVGSNEQGPMAEVSRHVRCQVRAGALRVEVDHPDVAELGGAGHEGIEEDRRSCRRAVDVDLLAARDACDGLGRPDDAHRLSLREPGAPR